MRKLLLIVFFLALIIRMVKLGSVPAGFHADEVRASWNAYSILKTGHDDRGFALPLYFDTFGDFRPTGIFYATVPFIAVFGLNEFSARLASSLFGALTIFPLFFFVFQTTKNKNQALFSAFLLSVSPWHVHLSRANSEGIIALFLSLWGIYFFVKSFDSSSKKSALISFILLSLSYLFYHSARLITPLFLFAILIYYWKEIKNKSGKKYALFIAALLFALTILLSFSSQAKSRLAQVSVFKSSEAKSVLSYETSNQKHIFDSKIVVYTETFLKEYTKYFSLDFFGSEAKPKRYASPHVGILTFAEIFLFVVGVIFCIKEKKLPLFALLLLLAPIPAAFTSEDSPNIHRSLFMLPFIAATASFGLEKITKNNFLKITIVVVLVLHLHYFITVYFSRSMQFNSQVRNFATKELSLYLNKEKNNFEEVVVTNDPDDPYPWFAFYNKLDPKTFNDFAAKRIQGPWRYQNIIFSRSECPSGDIFPNKFQQPLEKNILVVDGFKCAVESKIKDGMRARILTQFKNPDGSIAYTLWVKSE